MKKDGITTKKLAATTGESPGTLKNYVTRSWLKQPRLEHYGPGNGRGSRLVWDRTVVNQVEQIQSYKALGHSLEQIDAILKEKPTNEFLRRTT